MPRKATKRRGSEIGRGGRPAQRQPPESRLGARFQHDATTDGRELKVLNIVDEFTREALAIERRHDRR